MIKKFIMFTEILNCSKISVKISTFKNINSCRQTYIYREI